MATESVAATPTAPSDVGLKREMGLIGATWASETSIIGSGWLFGALYRLAGRGADRPAGLGHRRRRGHLPGPGARRTGRDVPGLRRHGAIPAPGVRQRGRHLVRLLLLGAGHHGGPHRVLRGDAVRVVLLARPVRRQRERRDGHGNVTGLGFAMTVVLLVIFTALNFLAMRIFNKVNSGHHLVEGGRPGPDHHRAAVQVPRRQLHQPGLQPLRLEGPVRGHPVGGHHVRLPRLRAGRPAGRRDQEPAEEPAPGHPAGHLHRHHHLRHAAGGVHRRDARAARSPTGGRRSATRTSWPGRSPVWPAWSASPGWP